MYSMSVGTLRQTFLFKSICVQRLRSESDWLSLKVKCVSWTDWLNVVKVGSGWSAWVSEVWVSAVGTWEVSALGPGEGDLQAGGEETSLLVPSSPDSSVTGERRVWQRPAVIWPFIRAREKERYNETKQRVRHQEKMWENMNTNEENQKTEEYYELFTLILKTM